MQDNPPTKNDPTHSSYNIWFKTLARSSHPIDKFCVFFKEITYRPHWSLCVTFPGFTFVGNALKIPPCVCVCVCVCWEGIVGVYVQSREMSQFRAWHSTTDRYVSRKPFQAPFFLYVQKRCPKALPFCAYSPNEGGVCEHADAKSGKHTAILFLRNTVFHAHLKAAPPCAKEITYYLTLCHGG